MADYDIIQGGTIPTTMVTKYADQGDGTHALVVATGAVAGGSDVTDRAGRLLGRTTNYDVTANGTLGVLNAVVTLSTVGLGSVGVAISGTWVGTIIAEGQLGDGVWSTIPLVDGTLGTTGLSTTVNGNFIIGVATYLNVRLRRNVFTNGIATVYLEGTRMVTGMFLTRPVPPGLNIIGSILVTDQIPGVGATNLGKADGALYAAGHTGVAAMGVRNDTDAVMPAVDGSYGPLTVDDTGRLRVDDNVPVTWASAAISGNTNGDNELVAVVASQRIYIVGITMVAAAAVNVTLESGTAGPDLTGLIVMAATGDTIVWPVAGRGWYARTDVGESLNMRLSGAVFVTGVVTYYTV